MTDNINNPEHYTYLKVQPLDVIQRNSLNFCQGNALKYLFRAGHKNDGSEDVQKACFYLRKNKGQAVSPVGVKEITALFDNVDRVGYYGEYTTSLIVGYFINPGDHKAEELAKELDYMVKMGYLPYESHYDELPF